MFNLFALWRDADDRLDVATLKEDFQTRFAFAGDYTIATRDLVFPRVTVLVLSRGDWEVEVWLRKGEDMTLEPTAVATALPPGAALPADFADYDTEIVLGFGDDPERLHSDDIIHLGEFVREAYPGVVIFDQYNVDLW